jgi:hypothetical protein
MTNRQEVRVQTRGPVGGNPTPKRQGRGAMGGQVGRPARARLVEVIGAWPFRAKAKRRKASRAGELASGSEAQYPSEFGVYWRRDGHEVCWSYPRRSAGFRASGRPNNARREADAPADQGPTRSTARWPKGRPNRACVGGEGKGRRRRWCQSGPARAVQDRIPFGDHGGRGWLSNPLTGLVASTDSSKAGKQEGRSRSIRLSAQAAPTGREPAGDGGHNLSSRRAVCEQHSYGSVRAGGGQPPLATRHRRRIAVDGCAAVGSQLRCFGSAITRLGRAP